MNPCRPLFQCVFNRSISICTLFLNLASLHCFRLQRLNITNALIPPVMSLWFLSLFQLRTPLVAFQKQSIMTAWYCWVSQIVFSSNLLCCGSQVLRGGFILMLYAVQLSEFLSASIQKRLVCEVPVVWHDCDQCQRLRCDSNRTQACV